MNTRYTKDILVVDVEPEGGAPPLHAGRLSLARLKSNARL